MALEIVRVSDSELERLAEKGGSQSVEALIVKELCKRRAKDYQVYAFRVGDFYFTGPVPDARTELAIIDIVEGEDEEG
jgi:hypothetical protein